MIVAYGLLAAPVIAAVLSWGSLGWVAVAALVTAVEYAALRRSQRFSAHLWRSIGMGRRGSRERGAETVYVLSAVIGVALLIGALLGLG